ncbi:MAG: transposase [Planctomycetia bacterium]|nr:transposase [Planctomycetia bacterium]
MSRHDSKTIIHVFVDDARYYHSKLLREFLIKINIRLHFLPAYSPNLNPIERLWRFFKKKVLYNQYFPDFFDVENGICPTHVR